MFAQTPSFHFFCANTILKFFLGLHERKNEGDRAAMNGKSPRGKVLKTLDLRTFYLL